MGLKTGQYYLRSRPARDAIQFTLDVDALDLGIAKNLSKEEMRMKKKRPIGDVKAVTQATDLNKKRKVSELTIASTEEKTELTKAATEEKPVEGTTEKPWEGKEKQEDSQDYRWNICENCQ